MADAVRELVENGVPAQANGVIPVPPRRVKIPRWAIISGCATCALVIGTCVIFILKAFGIL